MRGSSLTAVLAAIVLLALLGPATLPARADDGVSVSASVDANEVAAGETLRYTIEIQGSGMSSVSPQVPSNLTNLTLVGGPSTSTQFSFVNGAVSSSKSFTWLLAARAAGDAHIPAAAVQIGGKVYRTDPIDVKVRPAGSGGAAGGAGAAPGRGQRQLPSSDRDPGLSEVRLENEISQSRVYVGQPIVLTTRLLTRVQVVDVSQGPDPTLPGFLLEESENNNTPERVFREGREYQSYVLTRRILTPTTPGKTTVPPEKRTVRIRARGGDPWQSFFSPQTLDLARATAPVTLDVLGPPREGRPEDFSGAVGTFRLEAVADRKHAAVGEGIGFQVTVTGSGNLKTALAPVFPPSADFRLFDPRVEEKASGTKPRTYTKSWSYVITPLSPGSRSLPAVSFSYFDPESGQYRRLSSAASPLVVERAQPGSAPVLVGSAIPRREVQALQRDIRFLKPLDGPLRKGGTPLRSRWWIWAVIASSIVLQPLAWYAAQRGGIGAFTPWLDRGRARRRALADLARAERTTKGAGEAPAATARVVLAFLAERCRVPAAGLTYDAIENELARRGVRPELRGELRSLLELCDLGRFAPAEQRDGGGAEGNGLLPRARTLVDQLDREIGRAA